MAMEGHVEDDGNLLAAQVWCHGDYSGCLTHATKHLICASMNMFECMGGGGIYNSVFMLIMECLEFCGGI